MLAFAFINTWLLQKMHEPQHQPEQQPPQSQQADAIQPPLRLLPEVVGGVTPHQRMRAVERLIHRCMDTWDDKRFLIRKLSPGTVLINLYLFRTMRLPDDAGRSDDQPLSFRDRLSLFAARLRDDPRPHPVDDPLNGHKDPDGALASEDSLAVMHTELIEWVHRRGPKRTREDHTNFVDDAIQLVIFDLTNDQALGRNISPILHKLSTELQDYNDNLPELWGKDLYARQVVRRLDYLATHVIYVQNEYGSTSATNAIGYKNVCAFLKRGLYAAHKAGKRKPDTELLTEIIAMFYDGPDAALCDALWDVDVLDDARTGAINKKREPAFQSPNVKKDWTAKFHEEMTHFVVTLLQAYLGMRRHHN